MLAAGWRTIHYVSAGVYEESGNREAKRGNVPDAGLRRAHHGDALADAEAWSRTFSASEGKKPGRQNSSERGDWGRSGDGAGGGVVATPRPGRKDVCLLF